MHRSTARQMSGKKKPSMILFYNKNKYGVDIVDNMLRKYSTRCASRRWPVAVWENILDVAALNAYILYNEARGLNVTRKEFLMQLSTELCSHESTKQSPSLQTLVNNLMDSRQTCHNKGCRNKTSAICRFCEYRFCGSCSSDTCTKIKLTVCQRCQLSHLWIQYKYTVIKRIYFSILDNEAMLSSYEIS